jgi:hypothetical protein
LKKNCTENNIPVPVQGFIRVIGKVRQLGGREQPVSASYGIKRVTGNENFTKGNNWDPN